MERLKEHVVVFPDLGVDRLEHSLEDVRELRREGVDNAFSPGLVEVVGVGEDGAPGGLEPGGEPLALLVEAGTIVEEKTDERFFGAGERGWEGLVEIRPLHGPREESRNDPVDLAGKIPDIQRSNPGLHQRPGDRFPRRGRLDHRRAVPGDGLDEADMRERKERPRRIGVTTLLDHALPLSPGRRTVQGDVNVKERLYDVANLQRPEVSQVLDDGGRERLNQSRDLGIHVAHRFQCFGKVC
ncbi:hypothetical protein DSECCO2_631540 [anaerobic digester metagenome]